MYFHFINENNNEKKLSKNLTEKTSKKKFFLDLRTKYI